MGMTSGYDHYLAKYMEFGQVVHWLLHPALYLSVCFDVPRKRVFSSSPPSDLSSDLTPSSL